MNPIKSSLCSMLVMVSCLWISPSHAATYYTKATNNSSNGYDWNSSYTWSSNAVPSASDDYVANNSSYSLRTPSASNTFGGKSLTIDSTGATAITMGVRTGDGTVSTVNNLTLGFARITASASDTKTSRLSTTALTFSATQVNPTVLDSVTSGNNRTLQVTATAVYGTGYVLTSGSATGTILLDFANASQFTGTFEHAAGILSLNQALDMSQGTLQIDSTASGVNLAYNVQVENLIVGSTTLAAGTYTALDLNGYLNIFSGSSTITVVPEPSAFILAGLGVLVMFGRLRRNRIA